jgi:hypothetical protein
MVDVALLPAHVQWAKAFAARPGLVTWSNNALDWSHMSDSVADDAGTEQCFRAMGSGHRLISSEWGKPGAMLMCARWFLPRRPAWFNDRPGRYGTGVRQTGGMYRDERFYSALPDRHSGWSKSSHQGRGKAFPAQHRDGNGRRAAMPRRYCDYAPATRRRDRTAATTRFYQRTGAARDRSAGGFLFRSLHSILPLSARRDRVRAGAGYGSEGVRCSSTTRPRALCPAAAILDIYLALERQRRSDRGVTVVGPISLMYGRAAVEPSSIVFVDGRGLSRVSHPLSSPDTFRCTGECGTKAGPSCRPYQLMQLGARWRARRRPGDWVRPAPT